MQSLAEAEVYGPAVRSMAFELRARRAAQAGWPLVMARNRWFQRVALSRLSQIAAGERAPILMSYSYAAAELFAFARRKGWRTVLGQIDPGPVEEEIVSRVARRRSARRAVTGHGHRRPIGRSGGVNARWPIGLS